MNFITAAKWILANYSTIVAAVALAEQMFPASGSGAQKLDWVKNELTSNQAAVAGLAQGDMTVLWPYIDKVIALIVKYVTKQ